MKRFFCLILSVVTILTTFCACSENLKTEFKFGESYLTLYNGSLENKLSANSHAEIIENSTRIDIYGQTDSTLVSSDYTLKNGIGIGSNVSEFINLFGIKQGYAMWETYLTKDSDEIITSYTNYEGKNIDFGSFDDRFLTVGFKADEQGNWFAMSYQETKEVWDLEASDDSQNIIAIISAGLDTNGNITKIVIDYGSYSEFVSYTHNEYIQYV